MKETKTAVEYACTYIEKTAEVDSYNEGCDPDTQVCTMSEGCDITAPTLEKLIEKIGNHFCLDIDDCFLPEENGEVSYFGYNRLETADCEEPTKEELKQWKKGRLTLYLAQFYFTIEKRVVSPVLAEEFKSAGLKTH